MEGFLIVLFPSSLHIPQLRNLTEPEMTDALSATACRGLVSSTA